MRAHFKSLDLFRNLLLERDAGFFCSGKVQKPKDMQSNFEVFATQPERKTTSLSPKGGFERGLLIVVYFIAVVVSCGSDDPAEVARRICDAQCNYESRCHSSASVSACLEGEKQECVEEGSQIVSKVRSDFINKLVECLNSTTQCSDDDYCSEQAALSVNSNALNDPNFIACQSRRNTCRQELNSSPFKDDLCAFTIFGTTDTIKAINDCVAKPCAEIAACLNEVGLSY